MSSSNVLVLGLCFALLAQGLALVAANEMTARAPIRCHGSMAWDRTSGTLTFAIEKTVDDGSSLRLLVKKGSQCAASADDADYVSKEITLVGQKSFVSIGMDSLPVGLEAGSEWTASVERPSVTDKVVPAAAANNQVMEKSSYVLKVYGTQDDAAATQKLTSDSSSLVASTSLHVLVAVVSILLSFLFQ
eukprot:GILJ01008740.1.p1 GENE.GILJ01008740.1~~GILJ01008740.1.p1  ORF type:complete len:189 (+),score=36.40 GILJ01008740.1:312-878(+)